MPYKTLATCEKCGSFHVDRVVQSEVHFPITHVGEDTDFQMYDPPRGNISDPRGIDPSWYQCRDCNARQPYLLGVIEFETPAAYHAEEIRYVGQKHEALSVVAREQLNDADSAAAHKEDAEALYRLADYVRDEDHSESEYLLRSLSSHLVKKIPPSATNYIYQRNKARST